MTIKTLNEIFINLYTNDYLRKIYSLDKEIFFNLFPLLNDDEKKLLLKLDQNEINDVATDLKYKLWGSISDFFEPLNQYQDIKLFNFFEEFYLNHKKSSYESLLEYAKNFGNFLLESFQEHNIAEIYSEIIKFNLQKIKSKIHNLNKIKISSKPLRLNNIPYLYPNVIIELYNYDIVNILSDCGINNSKKIDDFCYLTYSINYKFEILRISKPLYDFLSYCSGAYKLSEIINIEQKNNNYSTSQIKKLLLFIDNLKNQNLLYLL